MCVIAKSSTVKYSKMYIEFLKTQMFKFTVMDDVFNEFSKTILNVDDGNCLATENLGDLKESFQKNQERLQTIYDELLEVPVPEEFTKTHDKILRAIAQYLQSLHAYNDAIDPCGNAVCTQIIKKQSIRRKKARTKLEDALLKIQELRVCL